MKAVAARLGQQLADRQRHLETILRLSPVGIGVTRLRDGMIINFNDAMLKLIGYGHEEVSGRSSAELNIWIDQAQRSACFARLAAGEEIRDLPSAIRRKDGEIRQVMFSAAVIELDGEAHMIGNLRDVTEDRQAALARDGAERRLQLSLSLLPLSICHQDRDLRYTYIANPVLGQPADAILGRLDADLFTLDDAIVLTAIKRRVLASGVGERHEIPIELAGQTVWYDLIVEPDLAADGRLVGVICAAADITELKRREQLYRAVVEDQTELISRFRQDGIMTFANEVYCRFFGKREAELVGTHWRPDAHPDDIARIEARLATITAENPLVTIENRVRGADGQEHWMQFVNRGLFDRGGRLCEIQSVGRDITARRRVEDELSASRVRLHALLVANDGFREEQRKEIARDIHDQLGAALTAIAFRVESLKDRLGPRSAGGDELSRIKGLVAEALQASRDICNQLRPPMLDDLGLAATCRWYLGDWAELVGIAARGRFSRLAREPAEPLRTDIYRVLQELLNNVARHSAARSVRVSLTQTRATLCLRVSDDGHGMAPERETSGHGLTGIRERMARHDGRLTIASAADGTAVTITLPHPESR